MRRVIASGLFSFGAGYNIAMPTARPLNKPRKKAAPLGVEGLLAYSARVLAVRAQTISELGDKLRRRAADPQDVDTVLARLKENGFLDDQRFAESFANWRRDSEGFGKTRVMHDLLARRVAPEVAKKAAETAYSAADETAMIAQYLERKFRGKDLRTFLQVEKNLASAFRRLRGAGFSSGNAIKVLKRFASEAERLEDLPEEE
jgi:regulatory protein